MVSARGVERRRDCLSSPPLDQLRENYATVSMRNAPSLTLSAPTRKYAYQPR